ncbi:MAG TPA: class I SAM-dependent methyltransferase [Anaerolineaceae bacterium]
MASIVNWHARFLQQASWTSSLRQYLFQKVLQNIYKPILEVGCGTGAIVKTLPQSLNCSIIGIDLDFERIKFASTITQNTAAFACADAYSLPFASHSFSLTYCHFLFLWIAQPERALAEMKRVTCRGGWIMAMAEPDYNARIDAPAELETLGRLQTEALRNQGVEPSRGRELAGLFYNAGLENIEAGILAAQWQIPGNQDAHEQEWAITALDIQAYLSPDELEEFRLKDKAAWTQGKRILYIPTFYAVGQMSR